MSGTEAQPVKVKVMIGSIASALPARAFRWNFTVMGLDLSLFVLALSFSSAYGVMPLFVHHLTVSNLALGLISAVRSAGAQVPSIFVAGLTEQLRRKKPFVVAVTVFERLPYLVLAVATPLLAPSHPTILLWLFFVMLAIANACGGIAGPAWLDLIARMVPGNWRGRFFGFGGALGGLLGVAGSGVSADLLHRFGWPGGFALCFGATSACLAVSFIFICLGREPREPRPSLEPASSGTAGTDGARAQRTASAAYWRRLPGVVRGDGNLRRYLVVTALINTAGMATAFYTVDAQRAFRLTDASAGLYAVALLAASTLGNVLWGYAGDHFGHKRVVEAGALCTALAAALALVARDPSWGPLVYGVVFLLVGLGTSGVQLAALTFIIDFAPPAQRPTYIGLATTAAAPFAVGAPLLAGLLADHAGYGAVFVLSAGLALAATLITVFSIVDPRMTSGDE